MGRERREDGRTSAGQPRRVEVDLTSVCVQRGSVQLPYRVQGIFGEGPVAAVDADGDATLELSFRPPRELLGLGGYFQKHGLRANDGIGLIFADGGLRIEAVKRERRSSSRGDRAPASTALPRRVADAPGERGRDPGPAAPPTPQHEPESRSAAPSVPPTLRMEVPTASVPTAPEQPADTAGRADAHSNTPSNATPAASGRRPVARWEPLDVTAAWSSTADEGAERDARGATEHPTLVREVRRQRAPEDAPARSESGAAAPRQEAGARPAARQDGLERRGGAREDAGRTPGPVQGRGLDLFGLRRRLGIGRAGSTRVVEAGAGDATAPAMEDRPAAAGPRVVPATAGGTGAPDVERPAAQAALAFESPARDAPARDAPARDAPEAPAREAPAAVAVRPSAPEDATVRGTAPAAEDLRAVASYLARPDIPAVVRAERVAEALDMSVARADAALDRIAEDSERLGRIRAQAYMVRRRNPG